MYFACCAGWCVTIAQQADSHAPTATLPCLIRTRIPSLQQYLQANLASSQLKELEAAWGRYQASTDAARVQRTSAAVQLQYAAALQSISWQKQSTQPNGGCTAERSQVR